MADKKRRIIASDNSVVDVRLQEMPDDTFAEVIVAISYEHQMIHDGVDFSHSGKLTLSNGASYDHLLVVPAGVVAHLHLFRLDVSGSPVEHFLYEDAVVSASGDRQIPKNRNRSSANEALIEVYHAPTVTSIGEQLDYIQVPGGKQEGGIGVSTPFTEWVLAGGKQYLSRITNSSGGVVTIGYTIDWYEPKGH